MANTEEDGKPQKPTRKKLGRPRKGFVKVLVSLGPSEAQALAKVARVRGLLEGKRGEVSELIREIIDTSAYWHQLARDVRRTLSAINSSPIACQVRDGVLATYPQGSRDAAGAALRAAFAAASKAAENDGRFLGLTQHLNDRRISSEWVASKNAHLTPKERAEEDEAFEEKVATIRHRALLDEPVGVPLGPPAEDATAPAPSKPKKTRRSR